MLTDLITAAQMNARQVSLQEKRVYMKSSVVVDKTEWILISVIAMILCLRFSVPEGNISYHVTSGYNFLQRPRLYVDKNTQQAIQGLLFGLRLTSMFRGPWFLHGL